jgi:uncharacterized protein YjbI with pentapeptide repeats
MANQEQVERLLQGSEVWNKWRQQNPEILPILYDVNLGNVNLHGANLSGAGLTRAWLSRADLSSANLNDAHIIDAHLYRTCLSNANLKGADFSASSLTGADLNGADLRSANLDYTYLEGATLVGANLTGANLRKADLKGTDLRGADLSDADLHGANLSNANLYGASLKLANLSGIQALGTNFRAATLTGACIQDWNINSETKFKDVICNYIFSRVDIKNHYFFDRLPHDPSRNFAPGEFTKRYQIVLETVELFFTDGIDWKAFLLSLEALQAEYGDELDIQGIEKKAGGSFLMRLEVPPDVDKGVLELKAKEQYETRLQILEARYHAELHARDREIEIYKQKSADILELAKLAASRPITLEKKQQVMVEQQSNSETYNTTVQGSVGNFANRMQDQASQQTNQYIGSNLSEITSLIHALRSQAESFPEDKRIEVIDHLEDLETDLKQLPEKRKLSRMKATLLALVGVATTVSGAVASTNVFVGQVQELSGKLGIPLPIEQVEP